MEKTPGLQTPEEDPRVRLAGERTLLAWIRTGLAMMGFGFVVARFGMFLRAFTPQEQATTGPGLSLWIGSVLILLGVAVNALAAFQHHRFLRQIDRGEPYRPPRLVPGRGRGVDPGRPWRGNDRLPLSHGTVVCAGAVKAGNTHILPLVFAIWQRPRKAPSRHQAANPPFSGTHCASCSRKHEKALPVSSTQQFSRHACSGP